MPPGRVALESWPSVMVLVKFLSPATVLTKMSFPLWLTSSEGLAASSLAAMSAGIPGGRRVLGGCDGLMDRVWL